MLQIDGEVLPLRRKRAQSPTNAESVFMFLNLLVDCWDSGSDWLSKRKKNLFILFPQQTSAGECWT